MSLVLLLLAAGCGPWTRSATSQTPGKPITIAVGGTPMSLVYGGGSVWTANKDDGTVSRIDPRTNRVVATIKIGGQPWGLAFGAGSIWVGNYAEGRVTRIEPASNRIVSRIPAGSVPIALGYGFGALWAGDYGDPWLFRIDPRTNRVGARFALAGLHLGLVPFGAIWVTAEGGDVVKVDPRTGRVLGRVTGGLDPTFVTTCGKLVWVTNFRGNLLWEIDPKGVTITHRYTIGTAGAGMACVSGSLWITKYYDNQVISVDQRGHVQVRVTTGSEPTDVLAAANSIWVADSGSNAVTRIPL